MFLWNIAVTSLVEVWIEMIGDEDLMEAADHVTSLVEVWIEMEGDNGDDDPEDVTSLVEVWIEIGR